MLFKKPQARRFGRNSAIATVMAAALVVAFAGNASAADVATPKTTLTIAATYGPTSLDPVLQSVDAINNWYVNLAYDTLIRVDSTGRLVPDLAVSWKYEDQANTSFLINLRPGVKFSDGTAITSAAVVKSLQYAQTKGVNGPNWLGTIKTITAPTKTSVRITTSESNDSLPFLLSQRLLMGSIINPTGLANVASLKSASYGAGAYMLDSSATVSNDTYVYVPNPNYWAPRKILWKKIVIKVVGNTTAALQAVKTGAADLASADAVTSAAAKSAGLSVATAPFGMTGVNYLDRDGTVVPALKDPRVRQALSYAINRPAIQNAVYRGYAVPGASPVLKGYAGFTTADNNAYGYDPAKAKALLAAAGYADGFSFNVCAPTASSTNLMAQAIVQEWAAIGVTAKLTTYTDLGQMTTDILAKKYPVSIFIYGALPTYIQAKSFFTGGANQFNPWNVTDAQLASTISSAAQASGTSAQDALYSTAIHRALIDLSWLTNVYSRFATSVYDPKKITGVKITTQNPSVDLTWMVAPAKTR